MLRVGRLQGDKLIEALLESAHLRPVLIVALLEALTKLLDFGLNLRDLTLLSLILKLGLLDRG